MTCGFDTTLETGVSVISTLSSGASVNALTEIGLSFDSTLISGESKTSFVEPSITFEIYDAPYIINYGSGVDFSGYSGINVGDGSGNIYQVKTLKFVGEGIDLSVNGDVATISLVPFLSSGYSPIFNYQDSVEDVLTYSRHVSNPSENEFIITPFNPEQIVDVINVNPSYNSNIFSIDSTGAKFIATLYDGAGLLVRRHEIYLSGNYVATENDIYINVYSFDREFNKYKAGANITFNLNNIFPSGGACSCNITYSGSSYSNEKSQGPIFYDPNSRLANIDGQIFNYSVAWENIKYLSSVKCYNTGTAFKYFISGFDYLNDASYPTNQVYVYGNGAYINDIALQGNQLLGWNSNANNVGAYASGDWWEIINTNIHYVGSNRASARIYDWAYSEYYYSDTIPMIVDTLLDGSTRIFEDFKSESKRLTSTLLAWDSTQSLLTYDGGSGLQVFNNRLIYPQSDFTSYHPTGQPNYIFATGNRTYYRKFWTDEISKSNGRFRLSDHNITETDLINGGILFDVSLGSGTWYSLNNSYLGGVLSDKDGCRTNVDEYNLSLNNQIEFTFGQDKFLNEENNWAMVLRITITESYKSKYIGGIDEVTWA